LNVGGRKGCSWESNAGQSAFGQKEKDKGWFFVGTKEDEKTDAPERNRAGS